MPARSDHSSSKANQDNFRFRQARSAAERFQLAYEVSLEITSIRDLNTLLEHVVYRIATVLNYQHVALALVEGKRLVFRAGVVDRAGKLVPLRKAGEKPLQIKIGEHITGSVALHGESILIPDVSQNPRYLVGELVGMRSELAVPLKRGSKVIGVLNVESSRLNDFTPEDQQILELLAGQIAITIENARLHEQIRRHAAELEQRVAERTVQLEEAEARYRTLFEDVPVGLFRTTPDGRILDVNPALVDMLGYPNREALLQRKASDVWTDSEKRKQWQIMLEQQGTMLRFETQLRRYDGKSIWVEDNARAVRDAATWALYYEGSLVDITERKQAEEALQRLTETLEQQVAERTAAAEQRAQELAQAEEVLRGSHEQLRNLAARLQAVREEERAQVARDIHDELGQALTALKMDLSWLGNRLPKPKEIALLEKIRSMVRLVDTTTQAMRRIATELRPSVLDNLGLVAAIEWQAQEFQTRTGIACMVAPFVEHITLDREQATTLFRICQESLTNVARHAGATAVTIRLHERAGNLVLEVNDNGKGITQREIADPKSLGLLGMRERAFPLDGEVSVRGIPGKGTTITARIPLHR